MFYKLNKYKWYILFTIIFITYFIHIFFKYYKKNKICNKNNYNSSIKTNSFLENKGKIITNNTLQTNIHHRFNKLNNLNNKNKLNTDIQTFHPLVIKISNIIIGRYNIKNKLLINKIYENVNTHIITLSKKYNKNVINSIINDPYKLNGLTDKITLNVSKILFKIVHEPLTKILIGQYIIKNSDNNNEIENVYLSFIYISKDTRLSIDERMNAIDMLNLSNNKKYIEISKSLLKDIRTYSINKIKTTNTTSITFNNNLKRIASNINNKNNVNNNRNQITPNINVPVNVPQLLVDRDGTTYPMPPDINVPPLNITNTQVIKRSLSIYDDSQNVHNSTINQTTLKTATELIKKYNPENKRLDFVYYKTKSFEELPPIQIEKIEKSIHRINTDTATFGIGFTLYILYQSLLNLIEKHKQKIDLEERLLQELIDMSGKCSTGHLSRLINVLQGFETDLKIKVKININDEIYAKIKHIIEKGIIEEENMDELMEDMLSDNKTIYIKFIKKLINTKIEEIIKEYEDVNIDDILGYENNNKKFNNISDIVTDIIIMSLDKYTGTKDHFTYLSEKNKKIKQ